MTYTDINANSRPAWPFLTAAAVGLTLATLAVPVSSSASSKKDDGVSAAVRDGVLDVNGSDGRDAVALRLDAADPNRIQVDVGDDGSADFSFARGRIDAIEVRTGDGRDTARIDDANGAFTDTTPTTISGGDGNDSLEGGQLQIAAENEKYRGGDGNDLVDGGKGNDTAKLGDGRDTFRWDNGEGSDVIEGQDGRDTMVFNGAPVDEQVTLTASEGRLTFFRVQGNVTMDTDGVEIVEDNPLGGSDSVTVNDLTGTDVKHVNLDLTGALGGDAGDGAVDNVVVNGTDGDDDISVDGTASGADVRGLAAAVSVTNADATDTLSVNTLEGADSVATSGVAGLIVKVDGADV